MGQEPVHIKHEVDYDHEVDGWSILIFEVRREYMEKIHMLSHTKRKVESSLSARACQDEYDAVTVEIAA